MATDFPPPPRKIVLHMLAQARRISLHAQCKRRGIGAVFSLSQYLRVVGYNNCPNGCDTCDSENCRAIHAEVDAVTRALMQSPTMPRGYLAVWAEIPCHNCLSFIRNYTDCNYIYCLSPEYYAHFYRDTLAEYRKEQISKRRYYAKTIGLQIIEIVPTQAEEQEYGIQRTPEDCYRCGRHCYNCPDKSERAEWNGDDRVFAVWGTETGTTRNDNSANSKPSSGCSETDPDLDSSSGGGEE